MTVSVKRFYFILCFFFFFCLFVEKNTHFFFIRLSAASREVLLAYETFLLRIWEGGEKTTTKKEKKNRIEGFARSLIAISLDKIQFVFCLRAPMKRIAAGEDFCENFAFTFHVCARKLSFFFVFRQYNIISIWSSTLRARFQVCLYHHTPVFLSLYSCHLLSSRRRQFCPPSFTCAGMRNNKLKYIHTHTHMGRFYEKSSSLIRLYIVCICCIFTTFFSLHVFYSLHILFNLLFITGDAFISLVYK